jgi:class 3 adenylate cyclase
MSVGAPSARSTLARIWERIGNPLEWNDVHKALIILSAAAAFLLAFLPRNLYLIEHPEIEPYISRAALAHMRDVGIGFVIFVALMIPIGLLVRHTKGWRRLYLHVANQSWWLMFAWAAYLVGLVTSPMWVLYIMLGFFCLLLFDLPIAASGMATCLVAIVATTLAERFGMVAYGPLYEAWPQIDGRLTDAWVISSTTWPAAFSLVAFGLFAVILTRARRQSEQLAQMTEQVTRANELISRYVAAQVAERILAGDTESIERHERRKLTIFFSDIRGFTEISERLEPEDLSRILNDYLSEMSHIVDEYGGTIDKFVGDAIMVFFGAPAATDDVDHALRAVRMAIAMQERMQTLPERWRSHAIGEVFAVRIGINTGHASIGNFGSEGRMDYTAIGRHVNLAARLEASCEPGKILISHATWLLVQDEIPCTPRGEIRVKGVRDPVTVYEVSARE